MWAEFLPRQEHQQCGRSQHERQPPRHQHTRQPETPDTSQRFFSHFLFLAGTVPCHEMFDFFMGAEGSGLATLGS